jgi:hypothetical protein
MNAKSLHLQTHTGPFISSRAEKNYRLTSLPRLRVSPACSHPELNAKNTGFTEHEVIFLMMK